MGTGSEFWRSGETTFSLRAAGTRAISAFANIKKRGVLPKEFPTTLLTLVQKLDAFDGDQLLRQCGERLRDLPEKPLPD
jgi:hypothetical protein